MKRALSLWLPMWPVDLSRRRRDAQPERRPEAILIAARVGQRREVIGRCEFALRAGVQPGMTVSDARALLGPIPTRIIEHAPERDAAALRALARWAVRFTPLAAPDPPDGLLLDVTGCDRLYGGEERLLAQLTAEVERLGFTARAAIAPTFACAWAVARSGTGFQPVAELPPAPDSQNMGWKPMPPIILQHALRKTLADLPTRALRIDDDTRAALAEVGIERIGELLALPRGSLRSRFGPELPLRIAQAIGEAIETIDPVRPAPPARAERLFDGPTTRWEAIDFAARELIDDLCIQLATRERGATGVELILDRSDAPPITLDLQLAGPTRDRRHLLTLLRPKLEKANLGFGIQRMELIARRSAPIAHRQSQRWRPDGDESRQRDRQLTEFIDTLSSRLGQGRVLRPHIVESHIPERAHRLIPALRDPSPPSSASRHKPVAIAPGDRPTLLLPAPEPARIITVAPDGPVLSLRWRGEDLRITTSVGPERIGAEWWRRPGPVRDYFKLQDQRGRWLWIYRQRAMPPGDASAPPTSPTSPTTWFVHGLWA